MLKIAALLWIVVGTALAGVAMTVIVTVPAFYDQGMQLIPIFCGAAFLVAMPVSWIIARRVAPQLAG